MADEQIIKKTMELIKDDLGKRSVPLLWVLKGIVAGAGQIFLNGIGRKMYKQFRADADYNTRSILENSLISALIIIVALIIWSMVINGWVWWVKLLLATNFIGLMGVLFYYVNNKKNEAEKLLQKKEKTDIKIEEKKEKEVPKLTSKGINI